MSFPIYHRPSLTALIKYLPAAPDRLALQEGGNLKGFVISEFLWLLRFLERGSDIILPRHQDKDKATVAGHCEGESFFPLSYQYWRHSYKPLIGNTVTLIFHPLDFNNFFTFHPFTDAIEGNADFAHREQVDDRFRDPDEMPTDVGEDEDEDTEDSIYSSSELSYVPPHPPLHQARSPRGADCSPSLQYRSSGLRIPSWDLPALDPVLSDKVIRIIQQKLRAVGEKGVDLSALGAAMPKEVKQYVKVSGYIKPYCSLNGLPCKQSTVR